MNTRLNNILKALAGLLLLGCTETSFALQPGSERMLLIAKGDVPWQSLSPEEQRELKGYRGNWKNYDTEKQNRIRDGAKRYMRLPPDRKEIIKQQRKHYRDLSPAEQKRLRDEYQRNRR
ncbi:MAG: DUF3106 domain-containing protein [Gammaproteobacteria bacterium]